MAYPPAVQAVLDRAGVKTLEEWNAAMAQGTAGGVNVVQRAMGHDLSEGEWSPVTDPVGDALRQEQAQQRILEERRESANRTWMPKDASIDMTVPSVWNPTPTNYNPYAAEVQASAAETARRLAVAALPQLTHEQASTIGLEAIAAENARFNGPAIVQEAVAIANLLEDRRSGIPVRAIDDLGGSAWVVPQPAVVQSQGEDMSLLGSIASGVGNFISGGAKALLESRRDTPVQTGYAVQQWQDPQSVPGMPSYQEAGLFPYGQVGQLIGKGAALLGTATAAYQAGQAVLQSGNRSVVMGGVKPQSVSRKTLVCPPKYVLGADGNCYPKSMIPRSARKWTPDPKPVVSRSDQKAITRAASAKKRLVKLTNAAGAHATITRPHKHTTSSRKK